MAATPRPLDAGATLLVVILCLSWGCNQVAVKLAIGDIPPLIQATLRSAFGAVIVLGWAIWRRVPVLGDAAPFPTVRALLPGNKLVAVSLLPEGTQIVPGKPNAGLAPHRLKIGVGWWLFGETFRSRTGIAAGARAEFPPAGCRRR